MRKSLNKTAFREYIFSCIDPENYGVTATTPKELINFVVETFEKEYWHDHNKKYYKGNKVLCFANYLMGLPSCINIDYVWVNIDELGIKFGLLDENSRQTSKQNFRDSWFTRVASEVFRLHDKLNK